MNFSIDDDLMKTAMRISGLRTEKETIEAGLRLLIRVRKQVSIRRLRGKVKWIGNLDESRR
jgi:Arc/MetJ family transcription regulator